VCTPPSAGSGLGHLGAMMPPTAALRSRRFEAVTGTVGAILFLSALVVAMVRPVPDWEVALFRWWNGLPDLVAAASWGPMQLGSLAGPMIVAAATVIVTMRPRPAVDVLLAGALAWWAARVAKGVVERGRPAVELDEVLVRAASADGLGFPSGHAAVAFAVAAALAAGLSSRWRVAVFALAAVAAAARTVHGAHFPADVVGGAGLGLVCAVAVRLGIDGVAGRVSQRT